MSECYKDIKSFISKNPPKIIFCFFLSTCALIFPGLLYLLFIRMDLFISLDWNKVIIFAVTYSLPFLFVCFTAELYYTLKYNDKASISTCGIMASGETISSQIFIILISKFLLDCTLFIYCIDLIIGIFAIKHFQKRELEKTKESECLKIAENKADKGL